MKTQNAIINISLPASLKRSAERQMKAGHYSTISDFMRSLIRENQKRQEMERLEVLLLQGMASGSRVMTPNDVEAWKKELFSK